MDGFHLDNATLEARGLLSVEPRLETFDDHGFDLIDGLVSGATTGSTLVGNLCTVFRLAAGEGVAREVVLLCGICSTPDSNVPNILRLATHAADRNGRNCS